MFELELMNLISEIKKTENDYELNQFKTSLSNLIKQNPQEYENFIQMQSLDENTINILKECESKISNENSNENSNGEKKDNIDDLTKIKNAFLDWQKYYQNNNYSIDSNCEQIVEELVNYYFPYNYDVLKKVFNIEDNNQNYNSFKWHIKNTIQKKTAGIIENYMQSDNYLNFNFIKKLKKQYELFGLTKKICNYDFDINEIKKLIKENE